MNFQTILLVVLSGLGVFHGIFISIILWTTKSFANISNKVLAFLMLTLSLRIGKSVLLEFSSGLKTIFVYLGLCLLLFIGPLFFHYCRLLVSKERVVKKKDILHFIPGFLLLGCSIPFQIFGFGQIPHLITVFLFLFFYGHFLSYLIYTRVKVINQKGLTTITREWTSLLFYGLLVIWVVYFLNLLEDMIPYIIGPIVYSLTVYTITFLAVSRRYLAEVNKEKYKSSNLTDQEAEVLFANLDRAMREEKLYLNPLFSLAHLSQRFRTTNQNVSQSINSYSNSNFNDYVNRYRVAYAQDLLLSEEKRSLTIASIGMESGFNSLSSFNQSFKKWTGKTPSAFRNEASPPANP